VRWFRSILPRRIHDAPVEIVATMRDVPNEAGHEMTLGGRHRFFALDLAFRYQKPAFKSLSQAHIGGLDQEINRLRWSDPPSLDGFWSSSYKSFS
jgi:hypothetical protein